MGIKQTLVVIGNGMVGQHFLASFVTGSGKDEYEIVTFCEEPRPAYDRVHLSEFFPAKPPKIYHWSIQISLNNTTSLFI